MLHTIEGQIARISNCSPEGVFDRCIRNILVYLLVDANRQETYQEAGLAHAAIVDAMTSLRDLDDLDRKARYSGNKGQPFAKLVRKALRVHRRRLRVVVQVADTQSLTPCAQDWYLPELEPVIHYFESIEEVANLDFTEE